ncbi:MAG: hypothetical protein HQL63_09795 [Magnetococcales bacterium]|nr:hypothetical protein [Magnetococcales bacterium]MBF0321506.1 hypothetical protein [Magnetococcales bacterium]
MSELSISSLAGRIDALTRRERGMILGALILLPWLVVNNFVLRPLVLERAKLQEDTALLTKSILDLTAQRERLRNSHRDAKKEEDVRLGGYRQQLTSVEEDVKKAMRKLVSPQEMTLALGALLRSAPGVTLTSLKTLPAQPIDVNPKKDTPAATTTSEKGGLGNEVNNAKSQGAHKGGTEAKPKDEKPTGEPSLIIWRHTLQLSFTSDYLSTLSLLQSLRGLPWTFYWDTLDMTVKEHPVAQINLTIFTLSLHEELIGA